VKIHLGCWHRHIPGFIHIDEVDMPHIDFNSNISNLSFINDSSVDLIYCSHAFEYFDSNEALKALSEWNRVLKQGATLRLSVPDFKSLIKVYQKTGDISKVLGPIYGRMKIKTRSNEKEIFHKTIYDEASLSYLLKNNGFYDIRKWDWRKTEHSMIDDHSQAFYPHMQKDNGIQISLNIECKKNDK